MDKYINILEVSVMAMSTIFAVSLGIIVLRLKISNKFNIRDHVQSRLSFDIDLKLISKMREAYNNSYNDRFVTLLNKWCFVLMITFFICYFLLLVFRAISR